MPDQKVGNVNKVYKNCGKIRKCWLPVFCPFPTMFSKGQLFRVVKSHDCVVKSKILDKQIGKSSMLQIKASMKHLGMSLVGWYHSHPYSPAEPSVKDIECQMMYQLKMKGAKSTYYPCVGIIICE